MDAWKCLATKLHATTRNRTIAPPTSASTMSDTTTESEMEIVRRDVQCVSAYEYSSMLCQGNNVNWCDWYLNIGKNDKAIEIAKKFHQDFEKLKSSPNIIDEINTIRETFLEYMPSTNEWNKVRELFDDACQTEKGDPLPIIKAYTVYQGFGTYINKDSAGNTSHRLKCYCTVLNCPILARTQEYTEAITNIFFHPDLKDDFVRKVTVYRGCVLDDEKPVANYKQGAIIITTTFLSTSTDSDVADMFADGPTGKQLSIFSTYNINNVRRRTALDLTKKGQFEGEREILIFRYVPFTIRSIERSPDGRQMKICFDECKEEEI